MVTPTATQPKRVAIIGSGLAGITMAYLLTHPDTTAAANTYFDVTIYEAAPTVGMDSHGMDVPCGCDQCAAERSRSPSPVSSPTMTSPQGSGQVGHVQQRMDSPFRMFIDTYYGTLVSMYKHLGIPFARANLDVCFARLAPSSTLGGNLQPAEVIFSDKFYSLGSRILRIPSVLLRPWTQWSTFRLYLDRKRFISTARRLRTARQLPSIQCTLGEYLTREGYSDLFIYDHLVPVLSVYMSAKHDRILAMPAATILDVYGRPESHVGWCTVTDGIATVCRELLKYLPKSKQRWGTKIQHPDTYDLVILATPASVSMRLISRPPRPSHTPRTSSSIWRTLPTTSVNHLRTLPAHCPPLLQTTNPLSAIDPAKIQGKFDFPRARLTLDTERALDAVYKLQGMGNLFIIGAPMFPGVPLLEGCVASAVDVAGRLGVQRPWKVSDGEYIGYQEGRQGGSIVEAFLRGELTYCDPAGSRYATGEQRGPRGWTKWGAVAAVLVGVVGAVAYKVIEV
ncbi:hypothetical protein BCR44DRAFT_1430036 [Catenaria anguillulae PL171]|uniref:Amine oxidase domain-containing protein n=1 Tax=Catenaria anguillulae PL171 TaxID=765915 RepID=A0A1Y2HTE0_9FUNG|nr:hypothetical protein BCR44DRAFT_1430036 [Catenaria anguillulae PL171]